MRDAELFQVCPPGEGWSFRSGLRSLGWQQQHRLQREHRLGEVDKTTAAGYKAADQPMQLSRRTIFAVYEKQSKGPATEPCHPQVKDILRTGNDILVAGYCMYGAATELVISFQGRGAASWSCRLKLKMNSFGMGDEAPWKLLGPPGSSLEAP
eukprot:Skav227866  [mRNA]  locus=scaffold383:311812:313657:+ [translate_table: standard]